MNLNISNSVIETASKAEANGQTIEINYGLPFVAIADGFNDYFFQGDEAQNLIDNAKHCFLSQWCTVEQILLWEAQSW